MTALKLLGEQIKVVPIAQYIVQQSAPQEQRYVFSYQITITNNSDQTVQLLNRVWQITDANGENTEVAGEGVVGQQPVLAPGEEYRYQSGSIFKTPIGTMSGHYEFINQENEKFKVNIPVFRLAVPNILN